jgi:hypothetical protein
VRYGSLDRCRELLKEEIGRRETVFPPPPIDFGHIANRLDGEDAAQ